MKARIISANAPYNQGGIGRFLAVLVEDARRDGELQRYFATAKRVNDELGSEIDLERFRWLFKAPPLRWKHGWRAFLGGELFDRAVARRLSTAEVFHGFGGEALRSFQRARELGVKELILESATSHVAHVARRQRAAAQAYPIEEGWLSAAEYNKTLREYQLADVITVPSEYARQSFIAAGVPAARLRRRFVAASPRFSPPPTAFGSQQFHVVYVGRLQVSKGVPLLLDAFAQLDDPAARLTLVGGAATEQMRRYLHERTTLDSRISINPGDPLPYLHRAAVLVLPSYEDALGLSALEALACATPVIVSAETGVQEFVRSGENGYVVPAGDVAALAARLAEIRARPLKNTFAPFRPLADAE